jgi:hypothetical protein
VNPLEKYTSAKEEDIVVEYNIPLENQDIHIVVHYSRGKYLRKEGVQAVAVKVLCTGPVAGLFFLDMTVSEVVKLQFVKSAKEDFFDSLVVPSPSPSPFPYQHTSHTPLSTGQPVPKKIIIE